jgi:hypothetical protein
MLAAMLTNTAQAYFGGRRADLARVLSNDWSASAVYLWKGVVPLAAARKLAEITKGELQVLDDLYDEKGNIVNPADKILKPVKKRRRNA